MLLFCLTEMWSNNKQKLGHSCYHVFLKILDDQRLKLLICNFCHADCFTVIDVYCCRRLRVGPLWWLAGWHIRCAREWQGCQATCPPDCNQLWWGRDWRTPSSTQTNSTILSERFVHCYIFLYCMCFNDSLKVVLYLKLAQTFTVLKLTFIESKWVYW